MTPADGGRSPVPASRRPARKSIYFSHQPTFLEYAGTYALLLVLLGLSSALCVVWYPAALLIIGVLLEGSQAIPVTFMTTLVLIVFAMFAVVMCAEPYLRHGLWRQEARERFARLAIPLVVIVLLGLVVPDVVRVLS
ncbi:MAG TPA: hypothetical protein VFZ25_10680 [Chloroflexota bacterium]|nr:hypothetical protein [Chloroflexota bacterium]